MNKFKLGDSVKIILGKDRGHEGKIEGLDLKEGTIIVPGVNMYKKHVKGQNGQKGGIYDLPRPMGAAKFALVCPKCKKETRVGFRVMDKEKVRICKKCGKEIDTK